jgi:carbon-monoxide dehydrogenase medium subunit
MTPPFAYHRPKTQAEALELLARPGCLPLIVHPKPTAPRRMGAEAFVDLSLLGLDYIRADDDGAVHIGALATLQEFVERSLLQEGPFQLLARAAGLVAGPGIRNLAGLWGALQARSGPPEVLLALLALEAQVVLLGAGEKQRMLPFPEFYAKGRDSLKKGELVLEVVLTPAQTGGWALERVARTRRDEAIVATAAVVEIKNGKAGRVALALAGANPQPLRLAEVEKKLTGKAFTVKNLRAAAEAAMKQAEPVGDFRGGADYRRAMAGLMTRRALEQAWLRAASRETEV